MQPFPSTGIKIIYHNPLSHIANHWPSCRRSEGGPPREEQRCVAQKSENKLGDKKGWKTVRPLRAVSSFAITELCIITCTDSRAEFSRRKAPITGGWSHSLLEPCRLNGHFCQWRRRSVHWRWKERGVGVRVSPRSFTTYVTVSQLFKFFNLCFLMFSGIIYLIWSLEDVMR